MIDIIKTHLENRKVKKKWRTINNHNKTYMKSNFLMEHVEVGIASYGELNIIDYAGKEGTHLKIGSYVSIASNVTFILNGEHNINTISTYPFKVQCIRDCQYEATSKGKIIVGDDVWIGNGATVISGVKIGQGVIIAAGAVVTKDVPPYTIVGGIPAKVIKSRFSRSVIDYLLTLDYSGLDKEMIKAHINDLYIPIDHMPLEEIKTLYSWFPKKSESNK